MSIRRHQGIPSHRGIHGKLPFAVRSRDGAMTEDGLAEWEVVPGVVDAAAHFMTRWHRGEAEKSWLCHAAVDANSSNKGKPRVRRGVLCARKTKEEREKQRQQRTEQNRKGKKCHCCRFGAPPIELNENRQSKNYHSRH